MPNHPDAGQRSHVDRVILLLLIDEKYYVPIAESAVEVVSSSSIANVGDSASVSETKPKTQGVAD